MTVKSIFKSIVSKITPENLGYALDTFNKGMDTFNKVVQEFSKSMDSITKELGDTTKSNKNQKAAEKKNCENLKKIFGTKQNNVKIWNNNTKFRL